MFLIENDVKYYKLIFYIIFMLNWNTIKQHHVAEEVSNSFNWTQTKVKWSIRNIFQFTKKDLVINRLSQIWINISREDFDFDPNLTDNEIKERYSPNETYIHIAPKLSTSAMFDMIWLDKNTLKDKNITDIWWWFTALPFELQWIVDSLEIVDPCFNWDVERLIDIDIALLEKFLQWNKTSLEEKQKNKKNLILESEDYIFDNTPKWRSLNFAYEKDIIELNKAIKSIEKSISSYLSVIDELKMWKELIQKWKWVKNNLWFKNTNLNSSVWEDIKWVADDSQDVVFINHLLTKPNVNPYLILSEASRITKKGWEIIVVNDDVINLDPSWNSKIRINHDQNRSKNWFRLIKK